MVSPPASRRISALSPSRLIAHSPNYRSDLVADNDDIQAGLDMAHQAAKEKLDSMTPDQQREAQAEAARNLRRSSLTND